MIAQPQGMLHQQAAEGALLKCRAAFTGVKVKPCIVFLTLFLLEYIRKGE
jgi:hypothetical protein